MEIYEVINITSHVIQSRARYHFSRRIISAPRAGVISTYIVMWPVLISPKFQSITSVQQYVNSEQGRQK